MVYVHPTAAPAAPRSSPASFRRRWNIRSTRPARSPACSSTGTLAKSPDIKWIFSHGGGVLPFLAARIARDPEKTKLLKTLYCDTASAASSPQLAAMVDFYPAGHILFGTDYPYVQPPEAIEGLARHKFSPAVRAAIDRGNAIALLPRLKKA